MLVPHGTDSGKLRAKGVIAYGFTPMVLDLSTAGSMHSDTERIPVAEFQKGIRIFYEVLVGGVLNWAKPSAQHLKKIALIKSRHDLTSRNDIQSLNDLPAGRWQATSGETAFKKNKRPVVLTVEEGERQGSRRAG